MPSQFPDNIARSREKAWDAVESQRHEIQKVFVHDARREARTGLDLLLVGVAEIELKSSEHVTREFLVRAVVSLQGESKEPRIRFWQPVLSKPSPSDQPILAEVDMD